MEANFDMSNKLYDTWSSLLEFDYIEGFIVSSNDVNVSAEIKQFHNFAPTTKTFFYIVVNHETFINRWFNSDKIHINTNFKRIDFPHKQ